MSDYFFFNHEVLKTYLLAGKCLVTLQSEVSNDHYTFKIEKVEQKNKPGEYVWFINQRIGSDSWLYKGMILDGKYKKPSKDTADKVTNTLLYLWRNITDHGRMPPKMKVYHNGYCGRCGRVLTNPASIISGLGPECASK